MNRQTGTTTEQIKNAPKDAIYVWCNSQLQYASQLARDLGRRDITVVSPGWLDFNQHHGLRRPVIIDHAAILTERQRATFNAIKVYLEAVK